MTVAEIAKELVSLCRQGENVKAIQTLYSPDIVSVEAHDMPAAPRETRGIAGVMKKGEWWMGAHTIHGAKASEPFLSIDKFAVQFDYDITVNATGKRMNMVEVAVYTVKDGKIVHEEFLYAA